MVTKKSEEPQRCTFCLKSVHEVVRLIAGPNIFICSECVELCNHVLNSEKVVVKLPDSETLLTPKEIVAKLDTFVIGQRRPKEVLAVAAYHHYKRVSERGKEDDGVKMQKANVLLIGPTGSGKTLLAETLAGMLQVPFAQADLTGVTSAGWVGNDVEDVLVRLVHNAKGDIAKAEYGIVFLDEVDKLGSKPGMEGHRDVGGTEVQNALLKMIEGAVMEVPVDGGPKHRSELVDLDTKNILFIMAGAFTGLEKVIAKRLREGKGGIGFHADVSLSGDAVSPKSFVHKVTSEDLVQFGFDVQLIGRLPNVATLDELDEAALVQILTEPKNALLRQYAKMIALEGATLQCDADAVVEIARQAIREKTGARALRAIGGKIFHETFLALPTLQKSGEKIVTVHLTARHVRDQTQPDYLYGGGTKDSPQLPK